jgi:hypothetical protein
MRIRSLSLAPQILCRIEPRLITTEAGISRCFLHNCTHGCDNRVAAISATEHQSRFATVTHLTVYIIGSELSPTNEVDTKAERCTRLCLYHWLKFLSKMMIRWKWIRELILHLIQRKSYLIAINIVISLSQGLRAPRQFEDGHSEPCRSLLKRPVFLTRTGVALLLPGSCRWFVASCYPSKLGKNASERNPN